MDRNNKIGFTDAEYLRLNRIAIDNDMDIHDMIIDAVELWNDKDDTDYHDLLGRDR